MIPEYQMARITSGCARSSHRPDALRAGGRELRRGLAVSETAILLAPPLYPY